MNLCSIRFRHGAPAQARRRQKRCWRASTDKRFRDSLRCLFKGISHQDKAYSLEYAFLFCLNVILLTVLLNHWYDKENKTY